MQAMAFENKVLPILVVILYGVHIHKALILRLHCKEIAEFTVSKSDLVLVGSVIASYSNVEPDACKLHCVNNNQCKSINLQLSGEKVCELNGKTVDDARFGYKDALTARPGWSFMSTDYNEALVGENCQLLQPCKTNVLCTDSCDCPGYQCHPCPKNKTGLHCYDWKDCDEIRNSGYVANGVYPIKASLSQNLSVFCDMSTTQDGWIVIQRRVDAKTDFQKDWNDYKRGFGDINGNYWMGLDKMNLLAGPGKGAKLRIDLKHVNNPTQLFYAQYDKFEVGTEADKYPLNLGGYSGDAGDSLSNCEGKWGDGCSIGMKFTTRDNDNDLSRGNCAVGYKGGWWYRDGFIGNLNSLHYDDVTDLAAVSHMSWYSLQNAFGGITYSEMKIKYN